MRSGEVVFDAGRGPALSCLRAGLETGAPERDRSPVAAPMKTRRRQV